MPTAGGEIELTYWPAPNQQEVQLADTLVSLWNLLHPDIRVRMQAIPVSQSTEEVLLAAIAGKTTPDICSNIWPGALHEYTQAGGLLPLDRFPGFDSLARRRIPPDLLATFRSGDGHWYQLPWKTNPVMMFYNRRLFEEAGVTQVPRTYSEYLAAGAKVSRDTNSDGQIDVWMGERDIRPLWWQRLFDFFPFYIAASGGKTLLQDNKVSFGDRRAEEVFGFFQQCYERRLFPRTYFQGGDPFLLEKKATHFAGPWQIATMEKFARHLRYGISPLPVPDDCSGPVYTSGDYKNIAIFNTTAHPEAAWAFVAFMVSADHDRLLLELCNQIPVRGDLLENPVFAEYFRGNPLMVTFAEQSLHSRSVDAAPDLKEILDGISQEYEMCAVYGKKSPAEAVRDAVRRAEMIIRWNQ
ncbi:MAG: extracellular solute-binding protein [Bacteroidota bacterium]